MEAFFNSILNVTDWTWIIHWDLSLNWKDLHARSSIKNRNTLKYNASRGIFAGLQRLQVHHWSVPSRIKKYLRNTKIESSPLALQLPPNEGKVTIWTWQAMSQACNNFPRDFCKVRVINAPWHIILLDPLFWFYLCGLLISARLPLRCYDQKSRKDQRAKRGKNSSLRLNMFANVAWYRDYCMWKFHLSWCKILLSCQRHIPVRRFYKVESDHFLVLTFF